MPTKQSKSSVQTLMRRPRVPRQRIRANTGGNETTFHSQYFNQNVTTGASNQAWGVIPVCPSLHSTSLDPGSTVARQYQDYVIGKHGIIFTPAVGTTTAGTIWLAYVDNPEIIHKLIAGSYGYADFLAIAQTTRHNKSVPIWEKAELSVNQTPRQKMFSVDTTSPASAEVASRTVQGCYIYATTAVPFSIVCGYITDSYTCRVRGLQNVIATGV